MSGWVGEWETRHCQNNQFLWFSELNPNVKESINLCESFVYYPTAGSKQTTADVLNTKEHTDSHIKESYFCILLPIYHKW